jgi:hypothetical protein
MLPDHCLRRRPDPDQSVLVPGELRLMLGWGLCDEPGCGNVRMIPPAFPVREARADD